MSRVAVIAGEVVTSEAVAERLLAPSDLAFDSFSVRVDEKLGRVAAKTTSRVIGPVHSVAVKLSWLDVLDVSVPAVRVDLRQLEARLPSVEVEKAQLDSFSRLGKQSEVSSQPVESCSERIRFARQDRRGV
jgi:hypothetical protein